MAHVWQHAHGKPTRNGYHNKEWAAKMDSLGLVPSSTGAPGGKRTGQSVSHYIAAGGPFAVACAELIATGLDVTWRSPGRPPAWRHAVYSRLAERTAAVSRCRYMRRLRPGGFDAYIRRQTVNHLEERGHVRRITRPHLRADRPAITVDDEAQDHLGPARAASGEVAAAVGPLAWSGTA
jgi:hypothetical protein